MYLLNGKVNVFFEQGSYQGRHGVHTFNCSFEDDANARISLVSACDFFDRALVCEGLLLQVLRFCALPSFWASGGLPHAYRRYQETLP